MLLITSLISLLINFSIVSNAAPSTTTKNNNGYTQTNVYCQPGQSCWPSDAEWQAFGASVGNRLVTVKPFQDPCYAQPDGFQPVSCQDVRLNYFQSSYRSTFPGAMQTDNWAYCTTNAGVVGDCSLTASTTGQLLDAPETDHVCKLGRLSPYAVKISGTDDVVKTLAFAQSRNPPIKIAVKGTGHDYLGRSSSPSTLLIWTQNLQSINYIPNFANGQDALALGAAVSADQAYSAAAEHNRIITLGAYASVGVAGGFAMGGGHGPAGPTYGLAVDNILQFTVVTVDGKVLTANANKNTDLFWALRGGGGGVFGIVTETVYALHPASSVISVVYNLTMSPVLQAGPTSAKMVAVGKIFAKMAQYQEQWTRSGWAGYNFFTVPQITFAQFLPSSNLDTARKDMQDFIAFLTTNTDYVAVPVASLLLIPNFEVWRKTFLGAGASNTPVAYSERLAGRLIPFSDFATTQSRTQLALDMVQSMFLNENNDQLSEADKAQRPADSFQIYSTGPKPAAWGGPSGANTGVNTAWRSSLWEVVVNSAWTNKMSQSGRNFLAQQTSRAGDYLRKHGTGCYMNEADVLEKNWQTAFFGDNYAKLLAVKKNYDPKNFLNVWKGIGFAGQENQAAFNCYQQA